MKSVCVLLSTYNGEKYLEEQVNSLLLQKNVSLTILARDDGSQDSTLEILKSYTEKDKRFNYYYGENIGPARSFLDLIQKSSQADYYAFCDQDDVWDDNKLSTAIAMLEKSDLSKPSMYYSNLRIVDQDLNFYRLSHSSPFVQRTKYSALVDNMATGCTIVFNNITKEYAKASVPKYCSMHDAWIYMICRFFGSVVYDFEAYISYRQHGNNVIGTYLDKRTMSIYLSRIRRLLDRKLQPRFNNAVNFYYAFGEIMNKEDAIKVEKIVNYKSSFMNRMKLLFDKEICSESFNSDLRYRILIILGII